MPPPPFIHPLRPHDPPPSHNLDKNLERQPGLIKRHLMARGEHAHESEIALGLERARGAAVDRVAGERRGAEGGRLRERDRVGCCQVADPVADPVCVTGPLGGGGSVWLGR